MTLAAAPEAATSDPLFAGLFDRNITSIPSTVEKQRYMTSIAPAAAKPGRWIEQPRLPIPVGEHAVIECMGKIHVIAGYARHRVDGGFHQVYDPKSKSWSQKAAFPLPCNHVAGVSIGPKIYTFGGFIEQNRCPHSKCFVYDSGSDCRPGAAARRYFGDRARRQDSFARRPRRAFGRMA
jgi:Kelch motif